MYLATEDQSAEIAMQQMDQQYAPLHLVSMISKYGTQQQIDNAKDSDLLTKERLCRALSMFEVVMQRIKGILMKNEQVRTGCCGRERGEKERKREGRDGREGERERERETYGSIYLY